MVLRFESFRSLELGLASALKPGPAETHAMTAMLVLLQGPCTEHAVDGQFKMEGTDLKHWTHCFASQDRT